MRLWTRLFGRPLIRSSYWQQRYDYGYNWSWPKGPYDKPYPHEQKHKQGLCHANRTHTPSRRGSWCAGGFVCHNCNMAYSEAER